MVELELDVVAGLQLHGGLHASAADRDLIDDDGLVAAVGQFDLGMFFEASVILSDQEAPIGRAEAIAAQAGEELHSGAPLVSQASTDLGQGDCRALGLTMAGSGWPKDHLLGQLAFAARINSEVNDQLDDALALITQAKILAR